MSFVTISLGISNMKNRKAKGARYFLGILALVLMWTITQGIEMASVTLSSKLFWANLQYIPITLIPVFYLYLSFYFTRKDRWLSLKVLKYLLLIVPGIMNILLWTEWIFNVEILRLNVHLRPDSVITTVEKTFGPWFWFFAAYNFLITCFTLFILLNEMRDRTYLYKKQVTFLFFGLLIPTFVTGLHICGIDWHNVDLTPASFGISAMILSFGIFEYGLFDLVPVARTMIIQNMGVGMIVIDHKLRILDINPAAQKILQINEPGIIGNSGYKYFQKHIEFSAFLKKALDQKSEIFIETDGRKNYYEASMTGLQDFQKARVGWLIQLYNITERKRAEELSQHAALHDALTGLPNRSFFQDLLNSRIEEAKARNVMIGIAFLDLDDFKGINDAFGHAVGDRVLYEVGQRIRKHIRATDFVARLGGDEFVLALPDVDSADSIHRIARKLLDAFQEPFYIERKDIRVRVSIGISRYPEDGAETDVLLKKADKAMYRVKTGSKAGFLFYDTFME